ncbi:MAG: hypothetical protein IJY27_04755 [Clostridia bacterium]|nr:hypothetical protein [Clostridia bacterium]
MKKTATFVLVLILLAALLCPSVSADVIIEPDRNSFFEAHRKECTYINRLYTVKSPGTEAFKSPEDKKSLGPVAAGSLIRISHAYTAADGTEWGVHITADGWDGIWLPMSALTVVYDYISFEQQHGASFVDFDASVHTAPTGTVCFWTYPGSGVVAYFGIDTQRLGDAGYISGQISKVYRDEAGRDWGYIEYYYGVRNVWVALFDDSELQKSAVVHSYPDAIDPADLPVKSPITTIATPLDDARRPTPNNTVPEDVEVLYRAPDNSWILPTAIALALAGAAAVLIVIFIKKNKQTKGS